MNVSIYMKEEYEDFHAFVRRKNKPNSKPILFSPQIYLGVEDWVEKTKPNPAFGRKSEARISKSEIRGIGAK